MGLSKFRIRLSLISARCEYHSNRGHSQPQLFFVRFPECEDLTFVNPASGSGRTTAPLNNNKNIAANIFNMTKNFNYLT